MLAPVVATTRPEEDLRIEVEAAGIGAERLIGEEEAVEPIEAGVFLVHQIFGAEHAELLGIDQRFGMQPTETMAEIVAEVEVAAAEQRAEALQIQAWIHPQQRMATLEERLRHHHRPRIS